MGTTRIINCIFWGPYANGSVPFVEPLWTFKRNKFGHSAFTNQNAQTLSQNLILRLRARRTQ